METNEHEIVFKDLSYKVVGIAMGVHATLGAGFLEKVYENAMSLKLRKEGIQVRQQASINVVFEGEVIGQYCADLLVNDQVILELKCVEKITDIHKAQTLNYLRATGLRLGIILNFAKPRLEYVRVVN